MDISEDNKHTKTSIFVRLMHILMLMWSYVASKTNLKVKQIVYSSLKALDSFGKPLNFYGCQCIFNCDDKVPKQRKYVHNSPIAIAIPLYLQ